ncbi:hypothetical protein T440DRAFT_501711 [Plenodomus tracheiphilus IPT5]|uniref:Uncharacterized protein n=1 Tax=Plenodomus tracheiphilus IPT5 TaxID=1408161 RepID=A0A6A7AWC0_9PLEO|nr:hypothetical protein T440DRAFT_501711 [Plenodomus tracheiphilus IPT5]
MVKGEILTLGAAAGAIGGAYKLSEFLYKAKRIRDVGPSNAVYVRIIGRVRADLDEVRRLLSVREVHDALESNPEKSKWVYGAMRDVRGALENITPHTERVAGDVEDGRRIGVRHRVYWLLSEKEKLENREKELNIAHASLTEVLGYLTALEPVEEPHKPKSAKKETHIDIDIHREAPQHTTEKIEREVYVDHRDAAPRRVEEHRDVWVERDHQGPPAHFEQHRDVYIDDRHQHAPPPPQYEEHHQHAPRDPRYEAQYDERYEQHDQYTRHVPYPQEDRPHYPEVREHPPHHAVPPPFPQPLGRRPESFEDRLPERETWMQSEARRNARPSAPQNPYGEYAEYGAPQPIGAAHYQLPLGREYEQREQWIEQKEDYRFDQYGNRLPDRFFQAPVPRPYRSRM